MNDGDIFVLNDPFQGGTHLPDITCIKPVFINDKLEFFAVSRDLERFGRRRWGYAASRESKHSKHRTVYDPARPPHPDFYLPFSVARRRSVVLAYPIATRRDPSNARSTSFPFAGAGVE